jgi:hypothetical protein
MSNQSLAKHFYMPVLYRGNKTSGCMALDTIAFPGGDRLPFHLCKWNQCRIIATFE